MTFFKFAVKSAWRKPVRTILLIVCISTTFVIYGLTSSFVNGSQTAAGARGDLLGVFNAAGLGQTHAEGHAGAYRSRRRRRSRYL